MKKTFLMIVSLYISNNTFSQISSSTFDNPVNFGTGNYPVTSAAGDLDGDGKKDIVISNYSGHTISVYKNIGTVGNLGACSFAPKLDFATGSNPRTVKIADMDNDGSPDILVANGNSNTFSIFKNMSSPGVFSFATRIDISTGNNPSSIAIGDIDNDGKLDVAVTEYSDDAFSVFINTSTSGITFATPVTFSAGDGPQNLEIGDLNGSGTLPEIVVTNILSDEVFLYENVFSGGSFNSASLNSAGTFTTLPGPNYVVIADLGGSTDNDFAISNSYGSPSFSTFENTNPALLAFNRSDYSTGGLPIGLAVADIDNDGYKDVAVAVVAADAISVFKSNSPGFISFAPKVDFSTGSSTLPADVLLADLDGTGDGRVDMISVNTADDSFSAFRNTLGTSSFASPVNFGTGNYPVTSAAGDLDGDGKKDVVISNYSGHTISVYENIGTVGNLGACSFAPKLDFATGSNPRTVKIADMDNDGSPDILVANGNSNTFSIFKNMSSPGVFSFATRIDISTGNNPSSIAIGDIDNDGKLDVAVTEYSDDAFSVFINTSTSGITFAAPVTFSAGDGPQNLEIGDLNGSGTLPEIVVTNILSDEVFLYENVFSGGSFDSASLNSAGTFTTLPGPNYVVIADLGGSTDNDFAISNSYGSPSFSTFENTNPALLAFNRSDYSTGGLPIGLAVADIDNDGYKDVAVAVVAADAISVFKSNSPGFISFAPKVDFSTGSSALPADVLLADLDGTGDGRVDMISVNTADDSFSAFRNISTPGIISLKPAQLTGIKSTTETLSNISVYPNPTDGITYVKFHVNNNKEAVKIQIYNFEGKLIKTIMNDLISVEKDNTVSFNTDDLPQGIYFIKIQQSNRLVCRKLAVN